ncbi:MAG: GlmU family protein [Bacteroidetes bacterium]|nr:GlmU family protein [Bacteroidota bacterium]
MNYVLFDDASWHDLLPLTFTRPCAEIRVGVLTIKQKWELFFSAPFSYLTQSYLSQKFPLYIKEQHPTLFINGRLLPNPHIFKELRALKPAQALYHKHTLLAYAGNKESPEQYKKFTKIQCLHQPTLIQYPWDIFTNNANQLNIDASLLTAKRKSKPISRSNRIVGKGTVFIEKGAYVECATINPMGGFVYIDKDAVVMEGVLLRGSLYLGEHAEIKMGAKIYGATSIGPYSKVGGEINNSVIFGYSNKGHDGFLGNSVLGEWCNLGADTNNSNLKNNYAEVKAYNYAQKKPIPTGLQFCGLIMGDHSKTGINTMLNTGTVVGVSANIFGEGFPATHVPSFTWGGAEKQEIYKLDKAIEVAERVMQRRNISFTDIDKNIFSEIFETA